jgi:hypothetical protein
MKRTPGASEFRENSGRKQGKCTTMWYISATVVFGERRRGEREMIFLSQSVSNVS